MNQIPNVDFQALGLSYQEYLQIVNCPDIEEEKPRERPVSSRDIVKKDKEDKELEASKRLTLYHGKMSLF